MTKKKVLVVGSGISGLSSAITAAKNGADVVLISPFISNRAQSVLAAGGINAALNTKNENDTVDIHSDETYEKGGEIANKDEIKGLCENAPKIVKWLEESGMVFSYDEKGNIALRNFGGQSKKRTAYSGTSTGLQIVTTLTRIVRQLECENKIKWRLGNVFLEALIENNECYGAVILNKNTDEIYIEKCDSVIMATGAMNKLFGVTTGSVLCDGACTATLLSQGVWLKNLEMIQYHPTTIYTKEKNMLISEAVRGEGGRLFYLDNDKRVYFMEDKFGENGNLMTRDVVSQEIFNIKKQVYLDISFLGEKAIKSKLFEIYDVCQRYLKLDITKNPIPVTPSVHFFMGGIAVKSDHQTSVNNLFAVGECASIYHGANRLGGNSLLAAVYSGQVAGENAVKCTSKIDANDDEKLVRIKEKYANILADKAGINSDFVYEEMSKIMHNSMGIVRNEAVIEEGLFQINELIEKDFVFSKQSDRFLSYMLENELMLVKAFLICAKERKETRGANIRSDYQHKSDEFKKASFIRLKDNKLEVFFKNDDDNFFEK